MWNPARANCNIMSERLKLRDERTQCIAIQQRFTRSGPTSITLIIQSYSGSENEKRSRACHQLKIG